MDDTTVTPLHRSVSTQQRVSTVFVEKDTMTPLNQEPASQSAPKAVSRVAVLDLKNASVTLVGHLLTALSSACVTSMASVPTKLTLMYVTIVEIILWVKAVSFVNLCTSEMLETMAAVCLVTILAVTERMCV